MALLTQLSSHSPETQSQAAMAIGHLCKYRPALQATLSDDCLPVLARLLHSPHPSVQQQAIYALGVMAAEEEAAASAVQQAGVVAPLTTLLLSSPSPDVKSRLTATLANVVRSNWRPVFNVGGFQVDAPLPCGHVLSLSETAAFCCLPFDHQYLPTSLSRTRARLSLSWAVPYPSAGPHPTCFILSFEHVSPS